MWLCGWYLASSSEDESRYGALCIVLLCCVIGNSAFLCVLGTVQFLPSRDLVVDEILFNVVIP